MKTILITGGSGFLGELTIKRFVAAGFFCVNIDLQPAGFQHEQVQNIQGDIRDQALLDSVCRARQFDAIIHLAALLAHGVKNRKQLWSFNVDGTRAIAEAAQRFSISHLLFTSSNCLWGTGKDHRVTEAEEPAPIEVYGQSKLAAERVLMSTPDTCVAIIFRCPTIIDEGRLGLLAILFEFIDEGRVIWLPGGGQNHYQFIYAQDLIDAFFLALDYPTSDIFNIGSDGVESFYAVYTAVIAGAGSSSQLRSVPAWLSLNLLRLAHWLHLSPLGPYQYKMIAENFVFATDHIKQQLHWQPTLTNADMLLKAYQYYHHHRQAISTRQGVSAHKQSTPMGILRLLKFFS